LDFGLNNPQSPIRNSQLPFSLQHSLTGFTLLEMMLAIVLFAVGTVAAMEVFHRAQVGSDDGEYVFRATNLAQQCLETLRNIVFGSLTVGSGVMGSVTGCSASPSGLPSGSRSVTVTSTNADLKQITVTVSWAAPGGTTNVVLQSYRSNI